MTQNSSTQHACFENALAGAMLFLETYLPDEPFAEAIRWLSAAKMAAVRQCCTAEEYVSQVAEDESQRPYLRRSSGETPLHSFHWNPRCDAVSKIAHPVVRKGCWEPGVS